jgi:glucose/arabinose dehydrogenase
MRPDGSAPEDNPYYDASRPASPLGYQYAKGMRNPAGLTYRRLDDGFYFTENGKQVDRLAIVQRAFNFGWGGGADDEAERIGATYNWEQGTAGAWAPVALAFVEGGSGFPAEYQQALFVATSGSTYSTGRQLNGKQIQVFRVHPGGGLAAGPDTFLRYVGLGKATVVGLAAGPDGLYFTDLFRDDGTDPADRGGNVWRVRYQGVADFSATPEAGGATLAFRNTSTFAAASHLWDLGDGHTGNDPAPRHTYQRPGEYVVSLRLRAADGSVAERLRLVRVP